MIDIPRVPGWQLLAAAVVVPVAVGQAIAIFGHWPAGHIITGSYPPDTFGGPPAAVTPPALTSDISCHLSRRKNRM